MHDETLLLIPIISLGVSIPRNIESLYEESSETVQREISVRVSKDRKGASANELLESWESNSLGIQLGYALFVEI